MTPVTSFGIRGRNTESTVKDTSRLPNAGLTQQRRY